MDPTSSLLDSINQAASSRSPSAQDVLAHASTINAPSELIASQRTTSAPSELAAPESAMSAPAGNGASDIVDIEVDGDDSPLSSASPEVVRLPRWDDLGRSYTLNHNLVHKFIPNFSFKRAQIIIILILLPGHDTVPVERGRLISTRSSVPHNSWGSAQLRRRTSCVGNRGMMGRPPT